MQQDQAMEGWREWVVGQMSAGRSRDAVISDMVAQGWEHGEAAALVASVPSAGAAPTVNYYIPQAYAPQPQRVATGGGRHGKNMLIGGLICGLGLAVTIGTYSAASGTGGRYTVAWGAIIFGGIQFVRGLFGAMGGE